MPTIKRFAAGGLSDEDPLPPNTFAHGNWDLEGALMLNPQAALQLINNAVNFGEKGVAAAEQLRKRLAARDASLETTCVRLAVAPIRPSPDELAKRAIATPRGRSVWNAMAVTRVMKRLNIGNPIRA
jgi:hypothetical protein